MAYIRCLLSVNYNLLRVCCAAKLFAIFLLEIVDLPEKFEGQALGQFLSSFERLKTTEKKRPSQSDAQEKIVAAKFLHQKAVVRVVIALLAIASSGTLGESQLLDESAFAHSVWV